MSAQPAQLLIVYARNVEFFAFRRGWSYTRLADELGITSNTLNRLRFARSRYIDPEVFAALLEIFACEPNDLLLPQPGINYAQPD
ncbi:MAG: helix-turn-helix domain-containing protein [Steroidobacteraceae bacterium]